MVTDDMAELGKLAAAGSRWSWSLSYTLDLGSIKILLGNLGSRSWLADYCLPVGSWKLLGTQGSETAD